MVSHQGRRGAAALSAEGYKGKAPTKLCALSEAPLELRRKGSTSGPTGDPRDFIASRSLER